MSYKDPYIGRTVHYVARGSADGKFAPECRAAIVTAIETSPISLRMRAVTLTVLTPQGFFLDPGVAWSLALDMAGPVGGTWHEIEECRGDYV